MKTIEATRLVATTINYLPAYKNQSIRGRQPSEAMTPIADAFYLFLFTSKDGSTAEEQSAST